MNNFGGYCMSCLWYLYYSLNHYLPLLTRL